MSLRTASRIASFYCKTALPMGFIGSVSSAAYAHRGCTTEGPYEGAIAGFLVGVVYPAPLFVWTTANLGIAASKMYGFFVEE